MRDHWPRPRSAAASQTSRSRPSCGAVGNISRLLGSGNVLRLVLRTQPRSGRIVTTASVFHRLGRREDEGGHDGLAGGLGALQQRQGGGGGDVVPTDFER